MAMAQKCWPTDQLDGRVLAVWVGQGIGRMDRMLDSLGTSGYRSKLHSGRVFKVNIAQLESFEI